MKKYYANGLVKQISNFKNGLKHGKWTYFYKNGKIHYTKNYKNGLLDGKRISFYENGSKAFEGSFKNGVFHVDGILMMKEKYFSCNIMKTLQLHFFIYRNSVDL